MSFNEFVDGFDDVEYLKQTLRGGNENSWGEVLSSCALRNKFTTVGVILSYYPELVTTMLLEDLVLTGRLHMLDFVIDFVGMENVKFSDDLVFQMVRNFYYWNEYEKEYYTFFKVFYPRFPNIHVNFRQVVEYVSYVLFKFKRTMYLFLDESMPWCKLASVEDFYFYFESEYWFLFEKMYYKSMNLSFKQFSIPKELDGQIMCYLY